MTLFDALNSDSSTDTPADDAGARFAVVIPAAGDSRRFVGFEQKKPFVDLNGRAIWLRTVEHFVNRSDVSEVVVVLAAGDIDEFRERFRPNLAFMNVVIVEGGTSRAESVWNGIQAITEPADYIVVHDAARPLLCRQWVTDVFQAAIRHKAVIPGVPVSSTVKAVDESGTIVRTVDRSSLVLAQTPQVYEAEVLQKAFTAADDLAQHTDEASLVEASGQPVTVHPGWPINIKITTKDDYHMAEALLSALPRDGGLQTLL